MFTWIPLYQEIARKVLEFENRQGELLAMLHGFQARDLKMYELRDELVDGSRAELTVIDPFTFFAAFNRAMTHDNRRAILVAIRDAWNLNAPAPIDFDGIPCLNPNNAWFFSYTPKRHPDDLPLLWQLARAAVEKTRADFPHALLDSALKIRTCKLSKLTIGMYWLNANEYLAAASTNVQFTETAGILPPTKTAAGYFDWLDRVAQQIGTSFPEVSRNAYIERQSTVAETTVEEDEGVSAVTIPATQRRIWLFAPGAGGSEWAMMHDKGVMAIGWDSLGDLKGYGNSGQIVERLGSGPDGQRQTNNAKTCWEFAHEVQVGDAVVAKAGTTQILGFGVVAGEYEFDEDEDYPHRRNVDWRARGEWAFEGLPQKTLTDKTGDSNFIAALSKLLGVDLRSLKAPASPAPPPKSPKAAAAPFNHADALKDLFMDAAQLDTILARLTRKKGIILQGPPGVGKTFVARSLAYALMGERDDSRVCMVQFHPSYGYEDFIQGYRPDGTGLRLRNGVFHEFARRARHDGRPYFFIIDEINRGNLAKIFGELLMLLEADKRGPQFAIPLTYADTVEETFWLPENLHVIGTMNTADRSLAMVDYALRRRFAFAALEPALHRAEFRAWLTSKGASSTLANRIAERVGNLNAEISAERDLGPGFRIGHSYFCPADAPTDWDAWYRDIIDAEIAPLLEEYFDRNTRVKELTDALLAG